MKRKKGSRTKRMITALCVLLVVSVIAVTAAVVIRMGHDSYIYSSYPLEFTDEVEAAAKKYDVDKYLIYAVIKTESDFDPKAVSSAGALGLMQIMPVSFEWIQTYYADEGNEDLEFEDLSDPALNIDYGTHLLKLLLDMYENEDTAVCAYNGGLGNVDRWLEDKQYSSDGKTLDVVPIEETSEYRKLVARNKSIYKRLYDNEK